MQEIFLELWKSASRYDSRLGTEVTFVATIARRRLVDRKRAQQRRPETESLGDEALVFAAPDDVSVEVSLASRALQDLSKEQREVLVLSAVEGLSHEEIAREKGMPLGTVKSHARRALLRIRALLLGKPEGLS